MLKVKLCSMRLPVVALDSSSQTVSTSPISPAGSPRPVVSSLMPPYWERICRAAVWACAAVWRKGLLTVSVCELLVAFPEMFTTVLASS